METPFWWDRLDDSRTYMVITSTGATLNDLELVALDDECLSFLIKRSWAPGAVARSSIVAILATDERPVPSLLAAVDK